VRREGVGKNSQLEKIPEEKNRVLDEPEEKFLSRSGKRKDTRSNQYSILWWGGRG